MHFSIDRTVHTTAFDKPVVDHWLERKIAQTAAGSTEKDRSDDRPLQRRARYRLSYIPLPESNQVIIIRHGNCLPICVFMPQLDQIGSSKSISILGSLVSGAGRSSEIERSLMVRWVVGSILHGVDPLSYFSFQPCSTTGVTKAVVCVSLPVCC